MGTIIDFDLSTVLLFGLIWIGITAFLVSKKKKIVYLIFFTIFYVYLVKVLEYTQFPIYLSESMKENVGQHVWTNMNLIPFIAISKEAIKTSALNLLLTIPFGFSLPFICDLRLRGITIAGLILSVSLELLQLTTALVAGFTFRIIDINDVIFNTLGAVAGYLLFILFIYYYRVLIIKWKVPQNPIIKYMLERPQMR
jgi:glycopeptide antibiotics resistance protein